MSKLALAVASKGKVNLQKTMRLFYLSDVRPASFPLSVDA